MVTMTEERITENNWNLTTAGKEVRSLCNILTYNVEQRASLDEVARLSWEIYNKVQKIIVNCDTEAE